MDKNLLAVDLVNPVDDYEENEERNRTDGEQQIDRILQNRGEEVFHGPKRISQQLSPRQTSFRLRGKTFLREARIR